MTSNDPIADRLCVLADQEFESAATLIKQFEFPQHALLFIEICRVMDFHHVLQTFSRKPEHKLPVPDFDIMVRGWNPALGLLLPHIGSVHGVPLAESTSDSRSQAMAFLHQLGRFSILKQSSDMVRHGMLQGELANGRIVLKSTSRFLIDHFLDRLDEDRLNDLRDQAPGADPVREFELKSTVQDLDARMEALVFPWKTRRGTMIGYHAEPDIDQYFLSHVIQNTVDWRNEAGIHPEARIGDVSGGDLVAIGLLLTSFCMKHIRFVDVGKKRVPDANYPMSLTIWKSKTDLIDSLAEFTGMEKAVVTAILDLFTIKSSHYEYFQKELTPYVPMLIEISDDYLLRPVSSIFRNPFHGIRMFHERRLNDVETAIRIPRENWMISDLCRLFMGTRYEVVDRSIRLRRRGHVVTDIDASVFDRTTGEVALFQLKWQDFSTNEIKKQKSKAKNFVDQVDEWADKVHRWVNEFGTRALCQSLQLHPSTNQGVSGVKLFAVGRSASRFQSYGYVPKQRDLAVCTWPQFVRIRYEVGPAPSVLQSLFDKIQSESSRPIETIPIPHAVVAAGQEVFFADLWNGYDDGSE